jgi:putative flippase GtrA
VFGGVIAYSLVAARASQSQALPIKSAAMIAFIISLINNFFTKIGYIIIFF